MSDSIRLQGTVLRIAEVPSGIGQGVGFTLLGIELDKGTWLDPNTVPRQARRIEIAGIDPSSVVRTEKSKPKVQGQLADERFVEIEIGESLPSPGGLPDSPCQFSVLSLRCVDYRPAGWGTPAWVFSLLNFKLGGSNRFGLYETTELRGDGTAAWYRDTTSFVYADREWFLTDLLDGKEDKDLRDFKKHWRPICSAELWTEQREGDQREHIELLARDITNVLSFATGRCVRQLDCIQLDAREQVVGRSRSSIWVAAAKDGGSGPIDTGDSEAFQAFMNAACKAIGTDTEWWARTLELHLQGALSQIIDVQLTFYYILLERVSNKVNKGKYQPQIDSGLDAALKRDDVKESIEAVFKAITASWTPDRTRQVIGEVQKWNAEPSMPNRVRMAAASLGLPEPDTRKVHPRNPMLHEGELSDKLPKDLRHHGDLARAVEALISAMLLRMLGHSGPAYLDDAGRDFLPIHPWPKERPCPWVRV